MEQDMRTGMLIGALAELTEVGVETIRFYERVELLPEPPRSPSGYRLYDADAVRRVRFILKAKTLGFTLAETRELLELRVTDTFACDGVAAKARLKIESVERRIRDLERVSRVLHELEQACAANQETS
jgi:DNA-binding transcriptional MerR regulator